MRYALVIVLLFFVGCANESPEIQITIPSNDAKNRQVITLAAEALFAKCPGLLRYRADIEWIKGRVEKDEGYYQAREYGWNKWVVLEVKIANPAGSIPNGAAQGHHLFYSVGGKPNPGIDVGKKTAALFCPEANGKAGFIPSPAAAIADQASL